MTQSFTKFSQQDLGLNDNNDMRNECNNEGSIYTSNHLANEFATSMNNRNKIVQKDFVHINTNEIRHNPEINTAQSEFNHSSSSLLQEERLVKPLDKNMIIDSETDSDVEIVSVSIPKLEFSSNFRNLNVDRDSIQSLIQCTTSFPEDSTSDVMTTPTKDSSHFEQTSGQSSSNIRKLSPLQMQLLLGDPESFEEKFQRRFERRLKGNSSISNTRPGLYLNLESNLVSTQVFLNSRDEILIQDSSDDEMIVNISSDDEVLSNMEVAPISDGHSEGTIDSEDWNQKLLSDLEHLGMNTGKIESISNNTMDDSDYHEETVEVSDKANMEIFEKCKNLPIKVGPVLINYDTNCLVFQEFTISFYPEQVAQVDIQLHDHFFTLPIDYPIQLDATSLKFKFESKFKYNSRYTFNLHCPVFQPHDFLQFFRLLSIYIPNDILYEYFTRLQPQHSIIFQSVVQIRNFIQDLSEVFPATKFGTEFINTVTLYDIEEDSLTDDELVQIFGLCVRNLYTVVIFLDNDTKYVGEIQDPLEYFKNPSTPVLPFGLGCSVRYSLASNYSEDYYGFWKNGKRHGEGYLQYQNVKYKGDFSDGEFDGEGLLLQDVTSDKIYVYEGDFYGGKKNGYGTMRLFCNVDNSFQCKEWYRGSWKDGEIYGFGEMRSQTIWKLGMWKRFMVEGSGIALNESTQFFERVIKDANSEERRLPMVPKGYFETLQNPQVSANPAVAQRVLYKGYCFRSRLETRWAMFFEFLGIDYLYECKRFKFPDKRTYTPDFYLPKMYMWIEIKPTQPIMEELERVKTLRQVLSRISSEPWRVLLIYGSCEPPHLKKNHAGAIAAEFFEDGTMKDSLMWVQCPYCSKIDIVQRGNHVDCPCDKSSFDPGYPCIQLQLAYENSQKFNFEGYIQHLQQFYEEMQFEDDELGDDD